MFSAYVVLSYVLSLRGNEGILLDLQGLRKHWKGDEENYFIISLFGKLKGEDGARQHLIPCINFTKSGINVKYTLSRLISLKEKAGLKSGPAISDTKGFLLDSRTLDGMLHDILLELFQENKDLFPPIIESGDNIMEFYRCNKTFRRTSDTRALEEKVSATDIDIVNRWEQSAGYKNKKVAQAMKHHYAQFELLLKPFLRYTYEM